MLKVLRDKKTAKKIWIGLAIIIIPAFALLGFGSSSGNRGENAMAGRIFGQNISNFKFKESLSAVRINALMRFGDKLGEIEKYLNLESQAWERLILLHEARVRKIAVGDQEIIGTIQSAPYFQDKKGFNNKTYLETLHYAFRLQPRIFEEQTRQNLVLTKLYRQITKDVKLNAEQIRSEYLKVNQELNIHYIASLFSDSAKSLKPSEQEITDFFEKNKAMFKLPPTKDKPTRIPELVEIKDQVKTALIQEKSQKIAENKIKECAENLKQSDFKQVAKTSGLKNEQTAFFKSGGQIENLGAAQIFWDNAKKLKDQEASGILSNAEGYYIIKLGAIKPIDEAKFKTEEQDFSQNLLSQRKNEVFGKFTEELIKKAQ